MIILQAGLVEEWKWRTWVRQKAEARAAGDTVNFTSPPLVSPLSLDDCQVLVCTVCTFTPLLCQYSVCSVSCCSQRSGCSACPTALLLWRYCWRGSSPPAPTRRAGPGRPGDGDRLHTFLVAHSTAHSATLYSFLYLSVYLNIYLSIYLCMSQIFDQVTSVT